jgi:hypothetical protein
VQNESYFDVLSEGNTSIEKDKNVFITAIYLLRHPSGSSYYLLVGKGSEIKGQEHTTLRVFYLGHNQLLECMDCFEGNRPYWTMQGSTQFPVGLEYHSRRKQLHYYEPTYDFKNGQRVQGLHYQLYWKDGIFRGY